MPYSSTYTPLHAVGQGEKITDEYVLLFAAEQDHITTVKFFISKGISLNHHDREFRRTALHFACFKGHKNIVELLLAQKVDVNVRDCYLQTPLHYASEKGHLEIVKLLVDEETILIDCEQYYKLTPLHFASNMGHLDIVKLLVEKGANVNHRGGESCTPLHFAACSGHLQVMDHLIASRSKIEAEDVLGKTPLAQACIVFRYDAIRYLVEKGANVNHSNKKFSSSSVPPLENLIKPLPTTTLNHINIIRFMIESGAFVPEGRKINDEVLNQYYFLWRARFWACRRIYQFSRLLLDRQNGLLKRKNDDDDDHTKFSLLMNVLRAYSLFGTIMAEKQFDQLIHPNKKEAIKQQQKFYVFLNKLFL